MGKMTSELIDQLYHYGKRVYGGEITLEQAVKLIIQDYGASIAESSTEFYIDLVKKLIEGDGSTWNQNSELLVYYVEHITLDYGKEAGNNAFRGGMRFAKSKSRNPLIDELNGLKEKYGFDDYKDNSQTGIMKQKFISWMKNQKRADGSLYKYSTIARYAKALERIVEQIDDLEIESTNLFYYSSLTDFIQADRCIRMNPNFNRINTLSKNGNGDLSAGMKQYMLFLQEMEGNMSGEARENVKQELFSEQIIDNKSALSEIEEYIASRGYDYSNQLIENLYLSLKTKPFVLLAGISGTGKTKIVKLFSEAIGAKYKLVSVRPDWSDSTDLFGHTDLQGKFVPGAIIDFINDACNDLERPYFLCMDEMNLARVEYYLSDYLSIIETRRWDNGHIRTENIKVDSPLSKNYAGLYLPENLYFIGTVNMDETTFPFSKKVLDRANAIEFSDVDLIPSFDNDVLVNKEPISLRNSFLKTKYITLKQDVNEQQQELALRVCAELQSINNILRESNSHIGYRVRDEIVFYMLNNDEDGLLDYNQALDNEIMQKILPRIQGSSSVIKDLLEKLFNKFAGDYSSYTQDMKWKQMEKYLSSERCLYYRSAQKVCYMMRRFEEDGFTSYWL